MFFKLARYQMAKSKSLLNPVFSDWRCYCLALGTFLRRDCAVPNGDVLELMSDLTP